VLGDNGGALTKMIPPFKMGLGGRIGSGKQWMPWIHVNDLIGIIKLCLKDTAISGAINGTAPNPVTNQVFSKALGDQLHRPAIMPMPSLAVKLLFGEMGTELLLSGKKVVPSKALNAGYQFKFSHLPEALADVVH
jgi:uncharacterized protein (TIGR01777 family)